MQKAEGKVRHATDFLGIRFLRRVYGLCSNPLPSSVKPKFTLSHPLEPTQTHDALMTFSARALFTLLSLSLASCGTLEIQRQNLNPFTLSTDIKGELFTDASSQVAYLADSQFNQQVQFLKVRVQTNVKFNALTPSGPVTLNFYARSSKPESCELFNARYYVCSNEPLGLRVGRVTLSPGESKNIVLEGAALDDAVRKGVGYLGLQLESGRLYATDTLEFNPVVATASL